jgi:glycosyltransferase 2 family protein
MKFLNVFRRIKHQWGELPKRLKGALGLVVMIFALIPLGWQLYRQRQMVVPHILAADWKSLLISWGFAVLDLGILAYMWLLIARRFGITLGAWQDLRIFFLSNFAKRVPGMVWYIAGRAYMYRDKRAGSGLATTGVLIENVYLFVTGLGVALLLWPQATESQFAWAGVFFLLLLAIILFALYPTVFVDLILRLKGEKETGPTRRLVNHLPLKVIMSWLSMYLFVWIIGGFCFYFFIKAFVPDLTPEQMPYVIGTSTAYSLSGFVAFFVPAGMGVKEMTGSYLISRFTPFSLAIVIMLLFRLNLLLAEIFWLFLSCVLAKK